MNSESAPSESESAQELRAPGMFARLRLSEPLRQRAFLTCCIAAVAVKVWLTLAFHMRAADAPADDRLFVALAEHLVHGRWLGPYDQYTLCKGPFFPIWIAATFMANIPLMLSYQLLHVAACALVIGALAPVMQARLSRLALFLVLLFDPSAYSVTALIVDRGAIYMPLTMIVVACTAAMLIRMNRGPRALVGWSVGLGLTLAAFWTTREEGVWILPFMGIALLYALVVIWRTRKAALAKTALLLLPAGMCAAGVLGVCAINQHYYGVFEVVDFKSEAFTRANGALMRVKPERWNQFSNVSKEVRLQVYEVSPAFAELRDYLEGEFGRNWGNMAEDFVDGGTPAPEDIRGGFFVWALRDAVQWHGHYRTATDAEAYYARVADEINAACDDGRLECGPERASLMPPLRWEYVEPAIASLRKGLGVAFQMPYVGFHVVVSIGPEHRIVIFEDIARGRIMTRKPTYVDPPRFMNQWEVDENRIRTMRRLAHGYRTVDVYVTAAAFVAFVVVCAWELRARSISPTVVILVGLFASFWARMVILVLISITSFDAVGQRYILPLYPMLLLFWFLSFHHLARKVLPAVASRFSREVPGA